MDGASKLHRRDTNMSNSTKANSENLIPGESFDIANPHADLELTEEELEAIFAQPFMDPNLAVTGNLPQSNRILDTEKLLVESKTEKLVELLK